MTWDEIYKGVMPVMDKVAEKVGQITDLTALELKKSAQEKALATAFARLGRLFYASVTKDDRDLDTEIAEAVRSVSLEEKRLAVIEARLRQIKERSVPSNESL